MTNRYDTEHLAKKIITDDSMSGDCTTNMKYKIIINTKMQKLIDKRCDNHIKERLFKKLSKLECAPYSYAKPLRTPLAGTWEIYFENSWRVLFKIDESNKSIRIVGFKHKDEMAQQRL